MSKKVYSYIRFSTPEQLKGDSLHRLLIIIFASGNGHGWRYVRASVGTLGIRLSC